MEVGVFRRMRAQGVDEDTMESILGTVLAAEADGTVLTYVNQVRKWCVFAKDRNMTVFSRAGS